MTEIQKKLSAYSDAVRNVATLKAQLARLEKEAFASARTINSVKKRIETASEEAKNLRGEAERLVKLTPEKLRQREILNMRYLLCMRWDDIADCLLLDRRWVMRLHRRALEELDSSEISQIRH